MPEALPLNRSPAFQGRVELQRLDKMDFNKFDNDAEESDDNYFAYVAWLSELTAEDLRRVKGSPEQQKQALCRYYKRGGMARLTTGALIDYLGVSSPSISEMASYTEEEGFALFVIPDKLTDDEISRTPLVDATQQPALPLE